MASVGTGGAAASKPVMAKSSGSKKKSIESVSITKATNGYTVSCRFKEKTDVYVPSEESVFNDNAAMMKFVASKLGA